MSCSLSDARERPPTRAASGKHGFMLARSLDLPPTETQTPPQPGVQLLPSLLSGAPRVCRGPLGVCRALSVAPREPNSQLLTSRTRGGVRVCGRVCLGTSSGIRVGMRTGVWVSGSYGCVGDWHAFVRQESCQHASCSRRFKSAAGRQTPRIH